MKNEKKAKPTPNRGELDKIFQDSGIRLSKENLERFWTLHRLLRARNEVLDLTRIHNFESMVLKHYVDSALVTTLISLPGPLLDIGTGAGFPGLPIKIMRPDLEIVLAESRGRRLEFLEEAISALNLEKIRIFPHKVTSDADLSPRGIITRDLEPMTDTLARAAGFLPRQGLVVFMKGPSSDPELEKALQDWGRDFRVIKDHAYTLGTTRHRRRLVVFERTGEPAPRSAKGSNRMIDIASIQNAQFKTWQKIQDSRGVKKQGLALASGLKQVREFISHFPDSCQAVLVSAPDQIPGEWPETGPVFRLRSEMLRELDLFGTGGPLLVLKVPDLPVWAGQDIPPGCSVLVPFQDPANVGAVIRTAAALGAAQVILLKEAAHPFHPKSLRAAGPAVFRVHLATGPSLAELANCAGPLFVLGQGGETPIGFSFPDRFGLVAGLEGPGLPLELEPFPKLTIPMSGGVESLNAAMALGLVLYEWRRGRPESGSGPGV